MNLSRVKAVIAKDFFWAKSNSKLLGLTVMPILFNIIFAKVGGASAFASGMSFAIVFLGIFLTSFLIIEEKRKGTLKALLTSPLTNPELLLGKFIFTFSLCFAVASFSILINNRADLFTNPVAMLSVVIFSATACFIGFAQGLFFKNEQEMSIASPLILLFFLIGSAINEGTQSDIAAFFPDYHFTKGLDPNDLSFFDSVFHLLYGAVIAFAAFSFAAALAKFYFSSNDEKRFSKGLGLILTVFMTTFLVSGFLSPLLIKTNKIAEKASLTKLELETSAWKGHLLYNAAKIKVQKTLNAKDLKRLKFISEDIELGVQIRAGRVHEMTEDAREKKIRGKRSNTVIAKEELVFNSLKFKKWVSIQNKEEFSVLVESFCNAQLFQVFFDLKSKEIEKIEKSTKLLNQILEDVKMTCKPTNSDSTETVGN